MMSGALAKTLAVVATLALTIACVPTVDEDPSLAIDGQILAIQFEPPEAEPEASSTVTALVANSTSDKVSFDLCLARKALSELGPVSSECFDGESKNNNVVRLGTGESVAFDVPEDACRLFGPQRPTAEPGKPPGRAVDPDASGGYYQPVVARLDETAIGSLRLECGLPGASQEQVAEYNKTHTPNQNPAAESVELRIGSGSWQALPASDSTLKVPRAGRVTIRSKWSAPERYLLLSPERVLTRPYEQYLATFYSSVGGFSEHRRLVEKRSVQAQWQAPETPQRVTLWIVVRDGRGGAGWTSFDVNVD